MSDLALMFIAIGTCVGLALFFTLLALISPEQEDLRPEFSGVYAQAERMHQLKHGYWRHPQGPEPRLVLEEWERQYLRKLGRAGVPRG